MFRTLVLLAASLAGSILVSASRAEDAFESTTEFGITVTANDIFDHLDEATVFWPAVRKYVKSPEFKAGDAQLRLQADAQIGDIQSQLHDRLMGDDEAAAADLIRYVVWNVRRMALFRQLRDTVGQPDGIGNIGAVWYHNYSLMLDKGDPVQAESLAAAMVPATTGLALSPDRQAVVRNLWLSISACLVEMEATKTGQFLRGAERSLANRPEADLTRRIAAAADWACIVKTRHGPAVREDFIAAWDALNRPATTESASTAQ